MQQPSNRRCGYYNKAASIRGGQAWFLCSTHQLFPGKGIYYDFCSFHLRTIRLEWLQTLEAGNAQLGIKEFRQPCTEHDEITRAIFSLLPKRGGEAGGHGCNHFRQRQAHRRGQPPRSSHPAALLGSREEGLKSPRSTEVTKTENDFSSGIKSLLRDSEVSSIFEDIVYDCDS